MDGERRMRSGVPVELRDRLARVHSDLLAVHKAVLDHEQARYAREHGGIGGPNDVLQLVIRDPFFAWLRPLTSLIVEIDEFISAKEPRTAEEGEALLKQARTLLVPAEDGDEFHRAYFRALQESPEVGLAHGEWRLARH